jgi:TetR/AcrR family transcriptional repressor of nem operon
MARPRQFDEARALDAALETFWREGYHATSLPDLLEAMGIARSSLYHAFQGKHELLLAALERYDERVFGALAERFARPGAGRQAIADMLAGIVNAALAGDRRGCLVGNCAIELAPHDAEVAERVHAGLDQLKGAFAAAVRGAQAAGDIDAARDADALAAFLMCVAEGLQLLAKAGADRATLQAARATALAALGG